MDKEFTYPEPANLGADMGAVNWLRALWQAIIYGSFQATIVANIASVAGDLTSRRGSVTGIEPMNGSQQISAFVPLSNMFGYATDMRSQTQGRGSYTMEPSHYAEVPKSIADTICSTREANRRA